MPDLTQEKLFPSMLLMSQPEQLLPKHLATLLYNTNDQVKVTDGRFEHQGRSDDVVKLNGYRVQLGEVDHNLQSCKGVRTSVTLCSKIGDDEMLFSFVTPASVDTAETKETLANTLPTYMIPSTIIALDALPVTAQGKPDRKSLLSLFTNIMKVARGGREQVGMAAAKSHAGTFRAPEMTLRNEKDGGESIATIRNALYSVTGAFIEAGDQLSKSGLNSLAMMKFVNQLRQAFEGVPISDLWLLSNPTIGELAKKIDAQKEAGEEGDSLQAMNMDAVFALRSLLALWTVRGHMSPEGCNRETDYGDASNFWRVNIFILLAGVNTAMMYDTSRDSAWQMLKMFVPPLLPLYFAGVLMSLPIGYIPATACAGTMERQIQVQVWFVFSLFMQSGTFPQFMFEWYPRLSLGHCWYLSAQIFFLLNFNWMKDIMDGKRLTWCFPCLSRLAGSSRIDAGPISTIRELIFRMWLVCLLCSPVMFFSKGLWLQWFIKTEVPDVSWFHIFGPLRLPQFYIGMLVGQACLHVELDHVTGRRLRFACDGLALLFVFLSFFAGDYIYMMNEPFLAFLVFALCRAPNTWTEWILRKSGMSTLAPFTYAIFIFHIPVMKWFKFTAQKGIVEIPDFFNLNHYTDCTGVNELDPAFQEQTDDLCPPFAYFNVFIWTIVLAILCTKLLHDPFLMWYGGVLARSNNSNKTLGKPGEDEAFGNIYSMNKHQSNKEIKPEGDTQDEKFVPVRSGGGVTLLRVSVRKSQIKGKLEDFHARTSFVQSPYEPKIPSEVHSVESALQAIEAHDSDDEEIWIGI